MIDLFNTDKRWLNVEEVMELFDVSRRTVYYWIADRRVESLTVGGTIRISVNDLRRQIKPAIRKVPLQTVARFIRVYPVAASQ
jgi:excisionase family DNA binding protein